VQVADIVGPVCESGDFFAKDREGPELVAGELVAILDAGAYGMSLASHYNSRVKPVEVMVEAGTVRVVRLRETLEETFAAEMV
jgi:diaminopimelate decarboxylase